MADVSIISYLTVFQSRLGLLNLVLEASGPTAQSRAALDRRVRARLSARDELNIEDERSARPLRFLLDKKLVGARVRRSGRYSGVALKEISDGEFEASRANGTRIEVLPVFHTDVWLAHPDVPSTVGVPTPDNAGEVVDLTIQLDMLSRARNTGSSSGRLAQLLRARYPQVLADPGNPFLLGVERVVMLRQLVDRDGLVLREIARELATGPDTVSRDEVGELFVDVIDRALGEARRVGAAPVDMRKLATMRKAVADSAAKLGSGGPGVIEHRLSPRLEWLTDLGYLVKRDWPKNAFRYKVEKSECSRLVRSLDFNVDGPHWADAVALDEWRRHGDWGALRDAVSHTEPIEAFRQAYAMVRRRVGPAPVQEVALVAGMSSSDDKSFVEVRGQLLELARSVDGITVSGNRLKRTPENIHMTDSALSVD